METAVRKATRLEYRPPKEKHLLTLKKLTLENPSSIDGILQALEKRLKEHSWIITYKVMVILHYLMRRGNSVKVMEAVLNRPSVLDASQIKNKTSAPGNVQNIYLYRAYLDERMIAFRQLKRDYVSESEGRLRQLSVSAGLFKETAALQRQMESVLKCRFYLNDGDPSITYYAYRMTTEDLLSLFQCINEAVVNILEHYFEMNKKDAIDALKIYKTFSHQTELTIDYLNEAKKLQNELHISIPSVKHAPLSLASALEEYLLEDHLNKDTANKQSSSVQPSTSVQQQPPIVTQPQQQQQQLMFQQNTFSLPQSFYPQQQQPIFNQTTDGSGNNNMDLVHNSIAGKRQTISNPFLSMTNTTDNMQLQQFYNNQPQSFNKPHPMFGQQQHFATISQIPIQNTGNSNPFRSMSMISPYNKPTNSNPFSSPTTSPLTPNQPIQYQNTTHQSNNPFNAFV